MTGVMRVLLRVKHEAELEVKRLNLDLAMNEDKIRDCNVALKENCDHKRESGASAVEDVHFYTCMICGEWW